MNPNVEKSENRRRVWAFITFNLCVVGLAVEAGEHLARQFVFDPFATPATTVAFIATPVMLLLNEAALMTGEMWARVGAFAATGAALAVAAGAAVLFVPAIPMTVFGLYFFGLGALGWTPFLTVGVLVVQAAALRRAVSESDGKEGAAALTAFAAFVLIVGDWGVCTWWSGVLTAAAIASRAAD
jgi:hypothetical protein